MADLHDESLAVLPDPVDGEADEDNGNESNDADWDIDFEEWVV